MSYTLIHPLANLSPTSPCPSYKRRGGKRKKFYTWARRFNPAVAPLIPWCGVAGWGMRANN